MLSNNINININHKYKYNNNNTRRSSINHFLFGMSPSALVSLADMLATSGWDFF